MHRCLLGAWVMQDAMKGYTARWGRNTVLAGLPKLTGHSASLSLEGCAHSESPPPQEPLSYPATCHQKKVAPVSAFCLPCPWLLQTQCRRAAPSPYRPSTQPLDPYPLVWYTPAMYPSLHF